MVQDATLYGVEQQMIAGRKPNLARIPPGPPLDLEGLEMAVADATASLIKRSFDGELEKADPIVSKIEANLSGWHCLNNVGANQYARQYVRIYAEAANKAFLLAKIKTPWDVVNRKAVEWAARQSAKRVTAIMEQTRKAIRGTISRGIEEGMTIPQIGRRIRDSSMIGLNNRQAGALDKFRDKLTAQAAERTGGLTTERLARIDRRVAREGERKLRYRADMIARTETASSVSAGTLESYDEAGMRRVEFVSSADACIVCLGYDGLKWRMEEADGIIPVHPSCRCSWRPVLASAEPGRASVEPTAPIPATGPSAPSTPTKIPT